MVGHFRSCLLIAVLLFVSCGTGTGLRYRPSLHANEEVIFIPSSADSNVKFETTIFSDASKDVSEGPIVIINHGSSPDKNEKRYRPKEPVKFFLHYGCTIIVPMRRGYSNSGGERVGPRNCDLTTYALENAADVADIVAWIRSHNAYRSKKIIMIGQSTGGLTTMAYSSFTNQRVDAIINMHGGVRPRSNDDCVLDSRIRAFSTFAKTSSPESLWLYTANDHSSTPEYIKRLYAAFVNGGGKAELHQLPAFKDDGHFLFGDPDGDHIWQPIILEYLNRMGIFKSGDYQHSTE